ncbi:MAG TPA: hypothetical protein V6D14_28125 [Coleofasciculaceae cyanobacterium]
MSYKDKLNPWCIIRPVSNVQMRIVGRFRRRVDAEGHLRILKQLIPNVPFEIMFDITSEHTDSEDLTPPTSSRKLRLPCEGRGEPDSNSPLKSRRGAGGEVN